MSISQIAEKFTGNQAISMTEFEFIMWDIADEDFLYFMKNLEQIQINETRSRCVNCKPLQFFRRSTIVHDRTV